MNKFKSGFANIKLLKNKKARRFLLVILTITLMFSTVIATFFRPGRVSADTALSFNEGYGTSVNDSNGNVSAGTITGSVWKTDDLCRREKCLYFDGSGDKVTFSDDSTLDFSATNTFTVSGWFRHPVISTNPDYLVTKHQSGVAGGYKIYMDSDGDISFGIDDDGTWGPEDVIGDDQGKNYDDNRWHYFAAVKDGTAGIYLYVDGVLIDQDTSLAANGSLTNSASFYVGIDADGTSNSWAGFVDEVKVVRQARSATQVLTDYLGSGVSTTGDGPVAHWKFDENTGTSTYDSTSNGNNSTTWTGNTTWATGKYGTALSFDGTNDVVRFAETTSTDLGGSSSYTLSAWFKTTANYADNAVILAKYDATGTLPFALYLNSSEQGVFQFGDAGGNIVTITGTTALNDGGWHHIVGVRDVGADTAYLYIDGKLIGSSNDITTSSMVNNNDISIGNAGTSYLAYDFNGQIDDVRIYGYARSATQVLEDMNANLPPGVSALFGSGQAYLSNGLVGYWRLDEVGDATRTDFSGNGNDLTESTSDTITEVGGKFGYAGDFERGDTEYLSISDAGQNGLDLSTTFTLSSWVKVESSVGNYEGIITKADGGEISYAFGTDGTGIRMWLDDDGFVGGGVEISTASNFYTAGVWTLITITYDGNVIRIYKDGAEQTTGDFPYTTNIAPHQGSSAFYLGYWDSQSEYFDGNIDEVRVYNRTLSSSEVQNLYFWAPGPIADWKLNENTGTVTNDSSSYGNVSSTFTGNTKWIDGKYGSGVVFDNNNGNIRFVETASTTDLGAIGSSYTVSAWVRTSDTTSSTDDVVAKHGTNSGASPFRIYLSSTTRNPGVVVTDGTNTASFTGTTAVNDNKWHYITVVRNVSTDTVYIYVDGSLENSATDPTTVSAANNDDISIGNGGASYITDDLNGSVDDVKIYNYARTPGQIVEDMNAGHPAPGSPVGSAVAYYKFDEGYGTTAYDTNTQNGGSEDLTLSTATSSWTNSGKFGKAFSGGGSRWATRSDDNDLDFANTDDFSISVWVKSDSATNPGSSGEFYVSKTDGATAGYLMSFDQNGFACGLIDDDSTWTPLPDDYACSSTDVYDTQWHHLVFVKTGTSKIELYLDGSLAGSDTSIAATGTLANSLSFAVGDVNGVDNGNEFTGSVDELKIFRAALNPEQIKTEYNQGKAIVLGALSTDASGISSNSSERSYCPPGDATATCSPVGEWKFDENTGTSAYDISTVSNTGTLNGTSLWEPGKVGQAVKFDGNSGYISVPYSASQDPTANLTVSFWFKPTVTIDSSIASNKGLISKANTNTDANNDWVFFWNSADAGRMRFGTYGDNIQTTNATWTAGTWYHIEAVVTSTNTANIYVNGKLDTYNADSNISTDPINGNQNTVLNIGLAKVASGDLYCSCTIDHFRLYDYARSFSQVAWDYALGMPHAWWRFDEGSGSSANDATGNGNTGTVTIGGGGSQTTTTQAWSNGSAGKYNGSINLDGNDDYVTITESDTDGEMDFNSGDQITVTAWINPSSLPATDALDTIVGKNNSSNGDGYYAQYQGNGAMEFCTINSGAFDCISSTTTPVVAGSWQFLVFTVTLGTDTSMKMYYNGRLQPNGGNGNNVAPPLSNDPVVIGANNGGTEAVTGKIDDVRIYRYTLSQQQIQTVMNQGAVRFNQ